ncbi:hypothetical protein [Effusibacillus consociatus]|uniref:Uncharacterized protein n=1 Tax=Effusibacillus consociatus TaxID=1117041 RepID=A0ABV9Q9B7_9BACL
MVVFNLYLLFYIKMLGRSDLKNEKPSFFMKEWGCPNQIELLLEQTYLIFVKKVAIKPVTKDAMKNGSA